MKKLFLCLLLASPVTLVATAKPLVGETSIPDAANDPLENRVDWESEYQRILKDENNYLSIVRHHPRSMKQLYMQLESQRKKVEDTQKTYLESIKNESPEFIQREKKRLEEANLITYPNFFGNETNISDQEKEARLNNRIKTDSKKFYNDILKNIKFKEMPEPIQIVPTVMAWKEYEKKYERTPEEIAEIKKQNQLYEQRQQEEIQKQKNAEFTPEEIQRILEDENKRRLGQKKIPLPEF